MSDQGFDALARALASPMSRRGAIGAICSALLARSALRPLRARAAGLDCSTPPNTTKCERATGNFVCVPSDWPCCHSKTCAGACRPWQKCTSPGTQTASCDDTPALCTHPQGGYAGQKKFNFCSLGLPVEKGICGDVRVKTFGWCCGPGSDCGDINRCICKSGRVQCGEACCGPGEYCETRWLGENTCEKLCPGGKQKCNGICCTGLETCGFFGCSCKPGYVSCGTGLCCLEKQDPGDPNPGYNPFRNLFNMMGQSSAAHSSSGKRALFAVRAQSGSAAVDAALDALAAVNGQGAAAMLAIREGRRDPAFKQKVTITQAEPPTLSAGPGFDANSAAALNALLVAEARASALIAAMAKALWRARAANARHNRAAAKAQLRASATFAGQAVAALGRIQALRTAAAKALTAGGVSEVIASDQAVTAFIASVKSSGIPPYLSTPMAKLGVGGADLEHLRAGVVDRTVTSASGEVLIAPLKNPARATELKSLISELSKYAARARKHAVAH